MRLNPLSSSFFIFLTIVVSTVMTSCKAIKTERPTFSEAKQITIQPRQGQVTIPISISFETVEKLLEDNIQDDFCGEVDKCEGLSYNYEFTRKPFQLYGEFSSIRATLPGAYGVHLSYCAKCVSYRRSEPRCIPGRLELSCGIDESLRRLEIDFSTNLSLTSDYRISSYSKINKVKAIDPCEITFLKLDASRLIEKHLMSKLELAAFELDQTIYNMDLRSEIEKSWAILNRVIPVQGYGFLYLRPISVAMSPLSFEKNAINTKVQIGLSPIFESMPVLVQPTPLPALIEKSGFSGVEFPLLSKLSFNNINKELKNKTKDLTLTIRRRKVDINSLKIIGTDGTKALFKVDFAGWREGELYLAGTPCYIDSTKMLYFPDLEFEIKTRTVLLKTANWLFSKKFTAILSEKLMFSIEKQISDMKTSMNASINRSISVKGIGEIDLSGEMTDIDLKEIAVQKDHIQMLVVLRGNILVKL